LSDGRVMLTFAPEEDTSEWHSVIVYDAQAQSQWEDVYVDSNPIKGAGITAICTVNGLSESGLQDVVIGSENGAVVVLQCIISAPDEQDFVTMNFEIIWRLHLPCPVVHVHCTEWTSIPDSKTTELTSKSKPEVGCDYSVWQVALPQLTVLTTRMVHVFAPPVSEGSDKISLIESILERCRQKKQ
jgi:hypothetical protein